MGTKSKSNLVLTSEDGKVLFEPTAKTPLRRNKLIKVFIEKAIREKWVLKRDLLFAVMNTPQSENITEFLELKQQIEKGEEQ